MPKFGLKCFVGSFLLSLVAIFAATKLYIVTSINEAKHNDSMLSNIKSQNIELFAANEENDPIYDKFNRLNEKNTASVDADITDESLIITDNIFDEQNASDEILYSPDDEKDIILAENDSEEKLPLPQKDEISKSIEENSELIKDINEGIISESKENDSDEIQIVDSSLAPEFKIPLLHKFNNNSEKITVSAEADASQVALASDDVALDNLGNVDKKAITSQQNSELSAAVSSPQVAHDDPWEVAETANKHTNKNAMNENKKQEVPQNTTAEPYKMQKNLLIPIPEDIMNEENLIPQFSSSEENLRLEEELRAKKKLPPINGSRVLPKNENPDKSTDSEDVDIDEETSQSLTKSISDWFSGNKPKKDKSKKSTAKSNKDQSNSIFNKLLGIKAEQKAMEDEEEEKSNVIPTELKLAFQPNRAEISGQTLEWLHAFSENVVKYENVIIEIRLSNTAPTALQQKRLKLLYRILENNGVNYDKVNIIFTDREPNSFIIRNVRYATEEEILAARKKAQQRAKRKAELAAERAKLEAEEQKNQAVKKADNPWF